MARAVYKLFMGKMSQAWHQMSEEEQEKLLDKVNEALEKVGGKRIVMCNSAWSSEEWPFFGVEEFPDIEAVQQHSQLLDDLNWGRYLKTRTLLGTEWPSA